MEILTGSIKCIKCIHKENCEGIPCSDQVITNPAGKNSIAWKRKKPLPKTKKPFLLSTPSKFSNESYVYSNLIDDHNKYNPKLGGIEEHLECAKDGLPLPGEDGYTSPTGYDSDPLMEEVKSIAKGSKFRVNNDWYNFDLLETCNHNVAKKGTLFAVGWSCVNNNMCIIIKFFLIEEWS